tara:strand:+ start:1255 stop:1506 length:252 start_codon:yes stop_codon:yes gene_type:complete
MLGDATMLWNGLLTIAVGSFMWWMRGTSSQIEQLRKIISQTREEIPKTYATKVEVERDIEKIMDRFDRLDTKVDNILERITRA